jgi:hypothetical protein
MNHSSFLHEPPLLDCPSCLQGEVFPVWDMSSEKQFLWMCEECDSTFQNLDDITTGKFYTTYFTRRLAISMDFRDPYWEPSKISNNKLLNDLASDLKSCIVSYSSSELSAVNYLRHWEERARVTLQSA